MILDSPKKPGAKDGQIGLSIIDNIKAVKNFIKLFFYFKDFFKEKGHSQF